MKQLHDIQLTILKKLLFAPQLRYTEMKPDPVMDNNHFDFHLKQLVQADLVEKIEIGYQLTSYGKEYANRMDTDTVKIQQQAKIGVFVCPIREGVTGREFLVYTRLKQPFYGCQGFMSGKLSYGEMVQAGARREFKEETNLDGNPEIVGIRHTLVKDKDTSELLEDKLIFLCRVINPVGELSSSDEGKFEWVHEDNLYTYITKPFQSLETTKKYVEQHINFNGTIAFDEHVHISDTF